MGKRSDLGEKRPRDAWFTIDPDAVKPLIPHIDPTDWFFEPCAGAGDLGSLLEEYLGLQYMDGCDLEPQAEWIYQKDATLLSEMDMEFVDVMITNPPFSWSLLKPLLDHLPTLKPTWLLLPADIIHNRRMAPYMERCHKIVSVGRLWWLPNKVKGVDNFVWLLFDYNTEVTQTVFYGRT